MSLLVLPVIEERVDFFQAFSSNDSGFGQRHSDSSDLTFSLKGMRGFLQQIKNPSETWTNGSTQIGYLRWRTSSLLLADNVRHLERDLVQSHLPRFLLLKKFDLPVEAGRQPGRT